MVGAGSCRNAVSNELDVLRADTVHPDDCGTRSRLSQFEQAGFVPDLDIEALMAEVVATHDTRFEIQLERMFASEQERELSPIQSAILPVGWKRHDLPILTALRRIQQRSDPLVVVAEPVTSWALEPSEMVLRAYVALAPNEMELPFVTTGQWGRTGIPPRWHVEVYDGRGRLCAPPRISEEFLGRGEFPTAWMSEGERANVDAKWAESSFLSHSDEIWVELELRNYCTIESPGVYTAVVVYHDWDEIANFRDLSARIVYRSNPVTLYLSTPRN